MPRAVAVAMLALPLTWPHGLGESSVFPGSDLSAWIRTYRHGVALDLHGTGLARVATETAIEMRDTVAGLRRHCSTYISFPDYPQFYLLAQLAAPTGFNSTINRTLLEPKEQHAVIAGLLRFRRRGCLLLGNAFRATLADRFLARSPAIPSIGAARSGQRGALLAFVYRTKWRLADDAGGFQIYSPVDGEHGHAPRIAPP